MSITLTHVKGPEAGSPNKHLHHSDISVPLPAVLGRGALLKCAEKKVSRRHATLDWDDDGVLINSVHVCPTFVIVSGAKQRLSQGESAVLGHGDKFGLLDDAFWFRVTLEKGKQSCDKENSLTGNTEAKLENENIKSKSVQENRNDALNQNKEIIINNNFLDSKEGKLNDKTSTIAKNETVSEYIKKLHFSSNDKLDASEGTSSKSSKIVCIENQTASTSNEEVTSSHGAAKVSLSLYTPKDLDDAVNDRKRTLPSWMSGSASSTKTDTSNKNVTSNAIQHGRKNNKPTQKKQNTSKLKDDSNKQNSDYVEENSKREKGNSKKSTKNSPSKYHEMSQNNDKEITVKKNERKEKLEKNKSPLKRSPMVSPAKKTPSKFHGLSQDINDDEISEEYDTETKNDTSDILHNLSDDGSDNNIHTPQMNLPSPRKFKTPEKESLSSENEDNNDAEFESNKTKNTVGSRLAGVTTITTTNTTKGDAGGRGRKRAAPRGSCAFGSQCYRKNPQHKDEYAHPGDSDYNENDSEDEDGDDDEREECEFGIDCYRKNPEHKKEFKHTRVPQPQRKAKRKGKAKKRGSDESESDDYDYDDPFLCDDSSDEYAPSDSGSDTNIEDNDVEEENTGRLLKEGKKFIRNN